MTWRVMKPCGIVLGVLLCAFVPLWVAQAQPDQSVVGKRISTTSWSAEQRARILSLGPWPPAPPTHVVSQRSTLNPLSGNAQAIAWGEQLFFDPRLSAQGKVSCATCHRPEQGYSDGRATALGVSDGTRNTMALFNLVDQRWFGWDGGADNLWAASIRPLLDAREMGSSAQHIATLLQSSQATTLQSLSEVVLKALGEGEGQSEGERQGKANAAASVRRDLAMVTVAMSIAAWIETIESPRLRPLSRRSGTHPRGVRASLGQGFTPWVFTGGTTWPATLCRQRQLLAVPRRPAIHSRRISRHRAPLFPAKKWRR
jgi:cytochrome c peroxidase